MSRTKANILVIGSFGRNLFQFDWMEECIDSFEMNIQNSRRAVSDVIGGFTKELRNRNV